MINPYGRPAYATDMQDTFLRYFWANGSDRTNDHIVSKNKIGAMR